MKAAVLSILTSGVAAQVTVAPVFAPGILNVAAVNPGDPGYQTCSEAVNLFEGCVSSLGGVEAAANADPTELIGCACCDGATAAAPLYSVCSNYLEEELPTASEQYEAYGTLYKACALAASCGGGSGGSATRSPRTTAVVSSDGDESASATMTSPAEQTYALACENMLGVFASCTRANRDFTELPFKEQAECYCCRGSGDRLTWTDEMGGYAKTCASWASTGEPDTILPVAETFASFCKRYTTACDVAATRTQDSETTATDDDNDNDETDSTTESSPRQTSNSDDNNDNNNNDATTSNDGPVTVTVPGTGSAASATETSGNSASSLRVGLGAVFAAVAALAVAL